MRTQSGCGQILPDAVGGRRRRKCSHQRITRAYSDQFRSLVSPFNERNEKMSPMRNLAGRVAVVTGGTFGVGSGIASVLAQYGARVFVTAGGVWPLQSRIVR